LIQFAVAENDILKIIIIKVVKNQKICGTINITVNKEGLINVFLL